jgi:O-antigen ligase
MDAQQDAGARSPIERFTTSINQSNDEEATFWSRVLTFDAAWEVIRDRPFIGSGMDEVSQVTGTGYQVHNVVLGAWYEAGALGGIGILLSLVCVLSVGVTTVSHARTREEWVLALALLASIFAFLVFAMSAPVLYKRIVWIGVGLMFALRAQQLRAASAPEVHPPILQSATRPVVISRGAM